MPDLAEAAGALEKRAQYFRIAFLRDKKISGKVIPSGRGTTVFLRLIPPKKWVIQVIPTTTEWVGRFVQYGSCFSHAPIFAAHDAPAYVVL